MKQALLYQGIMISIDSIDQVKESNITSNNIIEQLYDMPQIRLKELLDSISCNDIIEVWEVSFIASYLGKPLRPHYVVILKDFTSLCTCMYIVNQGMLCRHQYRILIQSNKAIFHLSFIYNR